MNVRLISPKQTERRIAAIKGIRQIGEGEPMGLREAKVIVDIAMGREADAFNLQSKAPQSITFATKPGVSAAELESAIGEHFAYVVEGDNMSERLAWLESLPQHLSIPDVIGVLRSLS